MANIILISGFGGSGKSTCAELLWERLENVAIVDADHLFRIKPFEMKTQEGRDLIGRVKLNNNLRVLETFLEEGFEYIINSGLVWSQHELDAVADAARGRARVFIFWLTTSKEVRNKRALGRARDDADSQAFLDEVESTIRDPIPLKLAQGLSVEILTDQKTPQQVVQEIASHLTSV